MSDALSNRRQFVRSLIIGNIAGSSEETALAYANSRYPYASPTQLAKSAIPALTTGGNAYAEDFLAAVRNRSVLGKLNFRRVPFNVRLLAQTQGATGHWTTQARRKPLSKPTLVGSTLLPRKVSAIIAQTKESLADTSNLVEVGLTNDLEKAVAAAIDEAFLDPNNAGIANEVPASITYGAAAIASSGSTFDALRADLSALISAYQGDLESAALVMTARSAIQISLLAGASAAVDLSASGGTLFGLPVATSSALAGDSDGPTIALVDVQAIAYALERLDVQTSDQTSLLMSDDPENDGGQMVSLWQTNTAAWRSEAWANWELQRTGGIILLTAVNYA